MKSVTVNKHCSSASSLLCAVLYMILCLVYPKDHQHNHCTIRQSIINLLEHSIIKQIIFVSNTHTITQCIMYISISNIHTNIHTNIQSVQCGLGIWMYCGGNIQYGH